MRIDTGPSAHDIGSFLRAAATTSSPSRELSLKSARHLGRGKLDIGLSYLYVNFDELDGDELDGLAFPGLQHNDCCAPPRPSTGAPSFEIDTADLFFDQFDIESHVVSLFATYGITDRWDVNILLPIIHTSLEVDARAVLNNESGLGTHSFEDVGPDGVRVTEERRSIDDSTTGVGDLQLRTKYHLFSKDGLNLASGLNLRLPTGDEDDFQGLGDTTLTPFFSLSQEYGRFDFHLAAGVEINADDTERSRVRYAGGVTVGIIEPLAFLVDVVGHSNVTDQEISVTVPTFANAPGTSLAEPGTETRTQELHTDIVDLALGFKAAFPHSLVGFAGVFVPLNDDGLRADVIPTANIEVSF